MLRNVYPNVHRALPYLVLSTWLLPMACSPAPDGGTVEPAGPTLANGSFTADLDGVPIHYEVHGSGPVLMTVPNSWGLTLEGLRSLYRPLEERLTLVYFDPRGMGESGAVREDADMGRPAVRDDFDALRRHLGLETVHAIGWSNGGTNLLELMVERPEILESAVVLHTAPSFSQSDGARVVEDHADLVTVVGPLQERLADPQLPAGEKEEIQRRLVIEHWFPLLFADPEVGRETMPELYRDTGLSWRHSVYANQNVLYDLTDQLPGVPVPTLVIAGAHDILPADRAEEIHRLLPDSRFVVFEDSGHFAPVEEPEKFQRVVYEFLGMPK